MVTQVLHRMETRTPHRQDLGLLFFTLVILVIPCKEVQAHVGARAMPCGAAHFPLASSPIVMTLVPLAMDKEPWMALASDLQ